MWWATIVICIWVCSTIGAAITKDSSIYEGAVIITALMGIGYLLIH